MWLNTIKLALRKLWNKKGTSLTKLFSLILGTVCLFYIVLYVHKELSYDTFHQNASKIVRVNTTIESPTGDLALGLSAIPVGPFLKSNSTQIQDFLRISEVRDNHSIRYGNKLFSETGNILHADPSFFTFFDFNLVGGSTEEALVGPYKMVLTQHAAQKYFGDTDALNQILYYDGKPFTVSGVMDNPPTNSHLQFDFLISMDSFFVDRPNVNENWEWFPMNTYLLLASNASSSGLDNSLREIPKYQEKSETNDQYVLSSEPLEGLHFSTTKLGEIGSKVKLSNLYLLSAIGLMILFLALSNYINLTTAQVSEQGKEVSIQKTLGASKRAIFRQFFIESLVLTSIAAIISSILIVSSFSSFERFMESAYDISFMVQPSTLLFLPLIPILLSLMGGIYPAIQFAKIPTLYIPKSGGKQGALSMRNTLLVFQFSVTSILVICSLIIYYQLNYLKNQDLGMDTSQKLVLEFGANSEIGSSFESLKGLFETIPGVENVAFSSHVPGQIPNGVSTQIRDLNGKNSNGEINLNLVDHDFIEEYGLQIVAGRNFRKGEADLNTSLILNEAAVKAFGYTDPEDILGAHFQQWGGEGEVIGVVKDFNYLSLHQDIGLLSLRIWPEQFMKITFDITESGFSKTLKDLNAKWTALYPDIPFTHYFVDDNFRAQYKKDEQLSSIINTFTLVSICIGILGLIAYANFWCERRRKEMSIRKVLGANVSLLIWKLYKGFSLPVLAGFLLAVPISYYFSNNWLQEFAYRLSLKWYLFVLPLLMLLVFAWIAVGLQTIRLVISNPVDALKEE